MAKPRTHDDHLLELARRGAELQLSDLMHEVKMLLELFPDLRDAYDSDELPLPFLLKRGAARATRRADVLSSRSNSWTAAKRRAAAARMKKYWAERRKQGA